MGVIGERYARHPGGARGAPRAQSKRKRLDVGVLPYCFVLFLLAESGSFLGSLVGSLLGLVESLRFIFRYLVQWVWVDLFVESLDLVFLVDWLSDSLGKISSCSAFGLSLSFGGVGC
jgi:hypothetical protein